MALDQVDQNIVDHVAEFGWSCMKVQEDDQGPGFAYTIGLWGTFNVPELIVFGLHPDVMHAVLANAVFAIEQGKREFDSARWEGLLDGYVCETRLFHSAYVAEYMGFAHWYRQYRGAAGQIEAFQIFWPGVVDHLLPWQDGSDPSVIAAQPFHWEAPR